MNKANILDTKQYMQQSQQSLIDGDIDSAIIDLTKSIILLQQNYNQNEEFTMTEYPNSSVSSKNMSTSTHINFIQNTQLQQNTNNIDNKNMMLVAYIRRGELYAQKGMYTSTISDYVQALSVYTSVTTISNNNNTDNNTEKNTENNFTQNQAVDCNLGQTDQYNKYSKFLSTSICMQNIGYIHDAADIYEQSQRQDYTLNTEPTKTTVTQHPQQIQQDKYGKLLASLLQINNTKQAAQTQQLMQLMRIKDKQIQQMKSMMDRQYKQIQAMRNIVNDTNKQSMQQMQQHIQQKIQQKLQSRMCQIKDRNYQSIFYRQIEMSIMNSSNKQKCQIYFRNFVMFMQKYYLAAKVLGEFHENSSIKFEDFWLTNIGLTPVLDQIIDGATKTKVTPQNKNNNNKYCISKNLLEKLFQVFDKHSSKIDKVSEVVKQLPYIGTAFKIIKSATKGIGWFQSIKVQNQCNNILLIRSNLTSFNQFSMHLAYQFYKMNRIKITMSQMQMYKLSAWQRMSMKYRKFRTTVIGQKLFRNVLHQEYEYVKNIAEMHVSIFMMGIAYGQFGVNPGQFYNEDRIQQLGQIVDAIQNKLITMQYLDIQALQSQTDHQQQSRDNIMVSVYDTQQLLSKLKQNKVQHKDNSSINEQKSRCKLY